MESRARERRYRKFARCGSWRIEATIQVTGDGGIIESPPEAVAALESLFSQALDGFVKGVEELAKRTRPRVS